MSQYYAESICLSFTKKRKYNGPEPLIWKTMLYHAQTKEVLTPLIRYKELAAEVFQSWMSAINETACIAEINGFPEDIDLETCRTLFNHYCTLQRTNKPGK